MNRRAFLGTAMGLLLSPSMTLAAPDSTPVSNVPVYIRNTTDLPALRYIVYRSFDSNSRSIFPDGMGWLSCFGMVFSTAEDAESSMGAFATGLWKWDSLTNENGWESGDQHPANMRTLGDASSPWTWVNSSPHSSSEWTNALTLVVQGRWMQGLWANSSYGNPVSGLADIAETTLGRWPNDTSTTIENGLHSGAYWDIMPKLTDMPEGVSLTRESEEVGPFTDRL